MTPQMVHGLPATGLTVRREPAANVTAPAEGLSAAANELAAQVAAVHDDVAEGRLREGAAEDRVAALLGPLQSQIAAAKGTLSEATCRRLVFLYAASWNGRGTFWAAQVFGAGPYYKHAWTLQFTLDRFDALRREVAIAAQPAVAVAKFMADEAANLGWLPERYRQLLAGLAAYLPEGAERSAVEVSVGPASDEGRERARADRQLFRLHGLIRAQGYGAISARAVAASLADPAIFRAASPEQRVELVAAAQAGGDPTTADLVIELAPEEERADLRLYAADLASFRGDLYGWALPNVRRYSLEVAASQMQTLRGKWYWGRGVPRYAAIEDRKQLVYALREKYQSTPESMSDEHRETVKAVIAAESEIIETASERDRAELRRASSEAIVQTKLPPSTVESSFLGELASVVGVDPEDLKLLDPLELLKAGFRKLAAAAGVDGEALLGLFSRAAGAIGALVRDPGRILGFLVSAVSRAFELVKENVRQLLVGGLVGFLTGSLASGGITLPTAWNLRAIVGFIGRLLGFTFAKVRAVVVKVIGEERVETVERVFGVVKTFFLGGPEAVAEQVQGELEDAKETAVGGLVEWAKGLVAQAVAKLASLFTPVGAIVTMITGIAAFIGKLQEWATRLAGVLTAVVESIESIVEGKIEPAARKLYEAVAGAFPVLLGVVAGFIFGNVDIAGKLRSALAAIQGKIESILERIVRAIAAPFKKLLAHGGKDSDAEDGTSSQDGAWWKFRKKIDLPGEDHELYVAGEPPNTRLMMASEPALLESFVERLQDSDEVLEARPEIQAELDDGFARIKKTVAEYQNATWSWWAAGEAYSNTSASDREKKNAAARAEASAAKRMEVELLRVYEAVRALLRLLHMRGEAQSTDADRPPSHVELGDLRPLGEPRLNIAGALRVEANISVRPGSRPLAKGSHAMPSGPPAGEEFFKKVGYGKRHGLHRAHLLNKMLHGTGRTWKNLALLSKSANDQMNEVFERTLKNDVLNENRAVKYEANVTYETPARPLTYEDFLPTGVQVKYQLLTLSGPGRESWDSWIESGRPTEVNIDSEPSFGKKTPLPRREQNPQHFEFEDGES